MLPAQPEQELVCLVSFSTQAFFVELNVGEDPPSLGLTPTSSFLCLIISSPLPTIIACPTVFVASMTA